MFGFPENHEHFCIHPFQPGSTNWYFPSLDSPPFNLWRFLNLIDLHSHITDTMHVGVVIPTSMGQSASSTCRYITHSIFPNSLRSINVNFMTVISTQQLSSPLGDPHIHQITIIIAPRRVPQTLPTGISNGTEQI